jgi:hypothetical protein
MGAVPVDGEQHCPEHGTVILLKLVADGRYQVLAGSGWMLAAPGRESGPCPGQFGWVVVPHPHA